ncbi:hypothetical protein [Pseudomonas sp. JG-B]|uniref:VirB4 family type IV secretion/conjugal transfer ATPase n=1 Tax=Pseudomonas sp. JG-B TaxID=2603214 RepID=UPI0015B729F5|nr:hypothetical protein [Pseudomonas sp. JG-B]
MLINELYVSIVYRPLANKAVRLLDRFTKKSDADRYHEQLDHIASLEELIDVAVSALDRYQPRVLDLYEHRGVMFSEAQEFLSFLLDGEWKRCALVHGEIRDNLSNTRPFFGKGGLMSFKSPSKTHFGSALVIENYPNQTEPGLINDLLSMPFEFVVSQSFTFISKPVAVGRMKRQQSRMVSAGDVAQSQVDEIDDAPG